MKRLMFAGLVVVAVASVGGVAAAQQGGGTTTTTTTERFEIVKKDNKAAEPAFENSTVTGVYTVGDYDDPDKGFYGIRKPDQQLYTGIIPRVRDSLPHLSRYERSAERVRKPNRLTWIGYQRFADKSRVFIQTGRTPDYEVVRGQNDSELIVILRGTRPSLYNFYRDVDCRWMYRSIGHIRSYRRGRDVYISIKLLSNVEFAVANDGEYVYVDFNDAHLTPGAVSPGENREREETIYDDPGDR